MAAPWQAAGITAWSRIRLGAVVQGRAHSTQPPQDPHRTQLLCLCVGNSSCNTQTPVLGWAGRTSPHMTIAIGHAAKSTRAHVHEAPLQQPCASCSASSAAPSAHAHAWVSGTVAHHHPCRAMAAAQVWARTPHTHPTPHLPVPDCTLCVGTRGVGQGRGAIGTGFERAQHSTD